MATHNFELNALRYESLSDRPSKVRLSDLGRVLGDVTHVTDFLDSLPKVLATCSLKELRDAIATAYRDGRLVLAALGGHVIKTGCGSLISTTGSPEGCLAVWP